MVLKINILSFWHIFCNQSDSVQTIKVFFVIAAGSESVNMLKINIQNLQHAIYRVFITGLKNLDPQNIKTSKRHMKSLWNY